MTPRILAIDCCGPHGGIALIAGGATVEEVGLHAPEGFSHVLFAELECLLARHGVSIRDIDCFAAASGPGSFTGLRVALAAVKGLAGACGRPAVGISTLQAMAWHGTAPRRATILDARRGEIFGALYDSRLEPVIPEGVCRPRQFVDHLPDGGCEFLSACPALLESTLGLSAFAGMPRTIVPASLAAAVGHIGRARFVAGLAADPAALDANYVRRSDAESSWRDF